ncbi:hypothetical protein [Hydrogenophaga sp. PBL-H3]|uniref:hypothetical protein n=1 Tax=Hydrogenophaga sp. PBL-H3 TaxID=434010 RepID=UPI00131F6B5E|nr:hypothetical protein [Hydrogenophaga sp. PBL-H3]QHE77019.1 hypothetical protein F9Z45_13665 [Hydrogenophaga sp. PBL-H3]QHE81443.1 hypothetical protein F9Z44_13665 [Hydrogenophaga sp. PBL-H3]
MAATCPCCSTVNTICFWGPRREVWWKRPALLVCCLPFAGGIPAILWLKGGSLQAGFWIVAGVLFAAALLGLVVSAIGCNACVARILGDL